MIENTYNRFTIWSAEGRKRNIGDSDKETTNDNNPLFGRIKVDPKCGIALQVTPTKKNIKKRDGK